MERMKVWFAEMMNDPTTPYWAKTLLADLSYRDPVDVANTLEEIVAIYNLNLTLEAAS